MALTEDSRPFSVLKENKEQFITGFSEDIETCLTALDSQISNLLRDPDSFSGSSEGAKRLNAHMEFSRAKYDIYVKMKNMLDEFETDWIENIAEIKASFLENVEIFLAGTKLEVKLSTDTLCEIENKSSLGSKNRRSKSLTLSPASSLYPKLFNTAKQIPDMDEKASTFSSEETTQSVGTPLRQIRSPKRVTILTPAEMKEMTGKTVEVTDDEDSEEQVVEDIPPRRGGRSSQRLVNTTPALLKKIPVKSALRQTAVSSNEKESSESNSNSSTSDANTPVRRRNIKSSEKDVNENISNEQKADETSLSQIEAKGKRRTRAQLLTSSVSTPSPGRKGRTPRKKANASDTVEPTQEAVQNKMALENYVSELAEQKTPKNVDFSVGMNINEDLDIYSPVPKISKATPRRKTAAINLVADNLAVVSLTPNSARGKSKRKTIAGSFFDETVAPSPKRLRKGGRSSIAPSSVEEEEPMDANPLGFEVATVQGHYSPWMSLTEISGSVPPLPGVYELKVSAAKKSAYIGGCDNLRQMLTLHKLKHNSGLKHLDKYIQRNAANILVRYEKMASASEAKAQEKIRVKAFVAQYNNPPAYN